MPTLRSNPWVFVMAPVLLILAGCGSNEGNIDTRGSTTAPEAATSPEDLAKKGTPPKQAAPPGYPGRR
jgi:hypothetical protein